MKRRIRAMALLAALTLLCGCGKKEAQPQQEDMAVNIVPVEGVTALELCDGEVTLRFARTDDTWHWVDDGTFPLDQDAVAALLALPLPTVLSKYHRALKKMRSFLEGDDA